MIREFQKFIARGNVIDLAVGIIMGAAFGAIVTSLVNDVIMPPIGYAMGGVDFSDIMTVLKPGLGPDGSPIPPSSYAHAQETGAVVIAWGKFINTLINFVIVAFAVFLLVRAVNTMMERMRRREEAAPAPATPTTDEKLLAAVEKLTEVVERKL
jgi:large conductance mechanosensitive channel